MNKTLEKTCDVDYEPDFIAILGSIQGLVHAAPEEKSFKKCLPSEIKTVALFC